MKKTSLVLSIVIIFILIPLFICEANYYHLKANKKIVTKFLDAAVNQKDFTVASQFLGNRYIQHDPDIADGPEALRNFIQFLRDKFPQAHTEVMQTYADGDYVILFVHSVREPNTRGRAIIDIFKLENQKIVEHWEVVQAIPEKSANSHGMF